MTFINLTLYKYFFFLPVITGFLAITSRSPIHAILWLISTFLLVSGLMFYYFNLNFICSIIIIIYIGAIAVLFLFIIMLIPLKERIKVKNTFINYMFQIFLFLAIYSGLYYYVKNYILSSLVIDHSIFWISSKNQMDYQRISTYLSNNENFNNISMLDLANNDIELYGAELYYNYAFPIILVALLLLFILLAAIILCADNEE